VGELHFQINNTRHASPSEAPQGGFFLPKRPFDKPAIPIQDQLTTLRQRGLVIPDEARMLHYLTFIGYYRLSGYSRYYAVPDDPEKKRFLAGTSFDQVLDLYIFDRHLRALLMDAFERIEVAVKSAISNECGLAAGPFWLADSKNFDFGFHKAVLEDIESCIGEAGDDQHQHQFIKQFYETYNDANPPCWMVLEALSFGAVSRIFKRTKGALRSAVGTRFKLHHKILESWLHTLVFARNVCAHHGRIWNRGFTITPVIPHCYQRLWPAQLFPIRSTFSRTRHRNWTAHWCQR
jgi:abortive infection bacteriophage resistance protein